MNIPSTALGEAYSDRRPSSPGFVRQPWMTHYPIHGAGHGGIANSSTDNTFSNFEQLPEHRGMNRSAPRQQSIPSPEELARKWPHYVSAARTAWGEIAESELLNLTNHTQKLAELIHARYAVTREEADMQVQRFFAKHSV